MEYDINAEMRARDAQRTKEGRCSGCNDLVPEEARNWNGDDSAFLCPRCWDDFMDYEADDGW